MNILVFLISSSDKYIFLYLIILLLVFITHYFTMRLRKMPIGRAWEAIRENDIAAQIHRD